MIARRLLATWLENENHENHDIMPRQIQNGVILHVLLANMRFWLVILCLDQWEKPGHYSLAEAKQAPTSL